jgi:hypothetical protein
MFKPINLKVGDTVEWLSHKPIVGDRDGKTYVDPFRMRGKVVKIYEPYRETYIDDDLEENINYSHGKASVAFPYSNYGLHSDKWPAPFIIFHEDEDTYWRKA